MRQEDWNEPDGPVGGSGGDAPTGWPPGVSQMTFEAIGRLGFGKDKRLYWDGVPVIVERRVHLELYQIVLASLATMGALLSGIHPFGQSFGWW